MRSLYSVPGTNWKLQPKLGATYVSFAIDDPYVARLQVDKNVIRMFNNGWIISVAISMTVYWAASTL